MESPSLRLTGKCMIVGGVVFSILSWFPAILNLHLLLSASHDSPTAFGAAGQDIVMAFGVHIGSLVIALGIIMMGLSKFYQPELRPYLLYAVGSWYILDCLSSFVFGYEYNIIPNTLFMLAFVYAIKTAEQDIDT